MNILIVDDEKLIVNDLKDEIMQLFPNANVSTSTDAAEALNLSSGTEFDVALLDIDMPGMDGISLARKLIAACPVINIIFVTGYGEYALEAHKLYCSAFLLKPVGQRKLKKAFENLRKPFIDLSSDFTSKHYQGNALIGERLKALRTQREIPAQELADLMGVSRQTIYRWENGERFPDVITFLRLLRILGSDIKDILEM